MKTTKKKKKKPKKQYGLWVSSILPNVKEVFIGSNQVHFCIQWKLPSRRKEKEGCFLFNGDLEVLDALLGALERHPPTFFAWSKKKMSASAFILQNKDKNLTLKSFEGELSIPLKLTLSHFLATSKRPN